MNSDSFHSGTLLPLANLISHHLDHKEIPSNTKNFHDDHFISQRKEREFQWSDFLEITQSMNSEDHLKQYSGLIGLRKLLSNSLLQNF